MGFFDDAWDSLKTSVEAKVPQVTEYFANKITQPLLQPKPPPPPPPKPPAVVLPDAAPTLDGAYGAAIGVPAMLAIGAIAYMVFKRK